MSCCRQRGGVLRHVWEGKFSSMLIEVFDGRTYVNGEIVESAEGDNASPLSSN